MTRLRRSLSYRLRRVLWRLLQSEVDATVQDRLDEASSRTDARMDRALAQIGREVVNSPAIAARALPRTSDGVLLTVPAMTTGRRDEGFAVPPPELQLVHADYLESGELHASEMRSLCRRHGFDLTGSLRVLDFGCGTGRVLRHLVDIATDGEAWGVDLRSSQIDWCRSQLSPPFHFLTSSTAPHLPFEDNYFDFVYGLSVFTHITDLDDAWLMELRRVTRPAGLVFLTVMDQFIIGRVLAEESPTPYKDWFSADVEREDDLDAAFRAGAAELGRTTAMFAIGGETALANVFHDEAHIRRSWGSVFELLEIVPNVWYHQSAVILRKQ